MTRAATPSLFLAAFGLCLFFSSPTLSPFRDAGDLAAAVETLGVAHPPGYPLYVLAGRAFARSVPAGNSVYRLNVFSAACAAGAAALLFSFARSFTNAFSAGFGALLFVVAPPALLQSGLAEPYALNALAAGAVWFSASRARRRPRLWAVSAFVFGLAAANHPSIVLMAPAWLLFGFRLGALDGKSLLRMCAAGLAGYSAVLFMPVRGAAGAFYVWGEPASLRGLWDVLLRADYGTGTLSARQSLGTGLEGVVFWFRRWFSEIGIAGGAATILGLFSVFLGRREAPWRSPLVAAWILTGPVFGFLARLETGAFASAILSPALVLPLWFGAAAAAVFLGSAWAHRVWRWPAVVLGGASIWLLVPGLPARSHRFDVTARDYAVSLERSLPPGAALAVISDAAAFSFGARQAAGFRPDVRFFVDAPLEWRWRRYRVLYPELLPDGGATGLAALAPRAPLLFTEGMRSEYLGALCPSGAVARVRWPKRTEACAEEMSASLGLWRFYPRRPPPVPALAADYYARQVYKTMSSNAYNAGLLLSEAGRSESQTAFVEALRWSPERMMRWSEHF